MMFTNFRWIIVAGLVILLSYSLFSQCPKQLPNCKGQCPRFMDENKDSYCDFTSITEIVLLQLNDGIKKKDTVGNKTLLNDSLKNKSKLKTKTEKNFKPINKPIETDTGNVKFVENTKSGIDTSANITTIPAKDIKAPKQKYNSYDLVLVSSLTIGLYLFTFLLSRFNKIKTKTHRKIWNILLLLTFIVSCLFGFFLVLQITYNFLFSIFRTILYWHVEIGISMTLIAVFHILWHLKYFKSLFKAMKSEDNE
jgi:hypothetical protein